MRRKREGGLGHWRVSGKLDVKWGGSGGAWIPHLSSQVPAEGTVGPGSVASMVLGRCGPLRIERVRHRLYYNQCASSPSEQEQPH